jgi:iron complex outermembrane recepter protein
MEGTMRKLSVLLLLLSTFSLVTSPATAQSASVSGRVLDAGTSNPLPARVEVLETQVSTTAGADGRFTATLDASGHGSLVISHPGYYVQRVSASASMTPSLEVRLVPVVTVNDRVEVTATRVREGVDPASFTNISREKVAETYWAQDPAVLLSQTVPGVFTSNDSGNGIGYSYFSIRGFGQARTRVTLNGAPLNDAESGELFFIDLADFMSTTGDVQVQRGVAGLSGLGGAVDFTTASPAVRPSFTLQYGGGSYDTSRFSLLWDSGLVNGSWAFSARYSKITTNGYRDQSWVDMWNYYFSAAHFGARSRARLVLFGGPEQTHLAYNGIDEKTLNGGITGDPNRDRRTNPITWPGEIDNFFQPHYQFVHEVDFSPTAKLSQTFYLFQGNGFYDQFRADRWLYEYDLPDITLPGGTVIEQTDLVRRRDVDEWDAGWVPSFSQQFGRLGLDVNGEVRFHRAHHVGTVTWAQYYPPGVDPDHPYYDYRVSKNTAAGAATLRYAASSTLTFTGGLQLTHHVYELSDDKLKGVAFTSPYTFALPRAGAVLKLAPNGEAYVNVARGMREPFFRNIYDPEDYYATVVPLNPEDVWNVEAGTSWRGADWRLRANAFWMNFINEIVYAGALDDNGVPVYGNGAKSHRLGAELDGSVNFSKRFGADAWLSLSRNTFTEYREHDWEGGVIVYDGNRVAGFPDVMGAVSFRADVGGGRVTAALRHVGRLYLDNTQNESLVNPSYTVMDVSARIPLSSMLRGGHGLGRTAIDLRVNNLFDATYTSFGYVDTGVGLFIPAAGRNVYAGLTVGF